VSTTRYRKRTKYVAVDNAVAEDRRLSFRARGVLVYLLAKPDGWAFSAERIARDGSEGREAVRSALAELRACGYYRVTRERGDGGRVVMVTEVSDTPREEWLTGDGFSGTGEPTSGKASPKQDSLLDDPQQARDGQAVSADPPTRERRAQTITEAWWESFTPRPTQPFIAAKRIVAALLDSWEDAADEQIVRAMQGCGATVVKARVDAALRGLGATSVGRRVDNRHTDRIAADDPEEQARRAAWS